MRFDVRPGVRRLLRLPARTRDEIEAELDDELESLLLHRIDYLMESGMSPEEARDAVMRQLGGSVTDARKRLHSSSSTRYGLRHHLRSAPATAKQHLWLALRVMRRTPVFTAVVMLTMALGIGASVAIFSAVDAVVLRPLPFRDGQRLVSLWDTNPDGSVPRYGVSYPDFRDWKARARSFDDMALYLANVSTLVGSEGPESVACLHATSNFLHVLGVSPIVGRGFGPDDERGESSNSVLLSSGYWQRRFASDRSVIGQHVSVDGRQRTIIGVLPSSAQLLGPAFVGTPLDIVTVIEPTTYPNVEHHAQHLFGAIGRLRQGATLDQARAELLQIEKQVAIENPEIAGWTASVFLLTDDLSLNTEEPLLLLLGASFLLLLIACINVANLLLVRGAARTRETAVRQALGASRTTLVAQFFMEALLLAFGGAVLGVGLAAVMVAVIRHMIPFGVIARADEMGLDVRVIGFAVVASLGTAVASGLWPALRSARFKYGVSSELRSRTAGGGARTVARRALVIAEVSLALVLVICAALVWQSVRRMLAVNPGFRPDHVVTASITLGSEYPDSAAVSFYRTLTTALEAKPGIQAAGATDTPPLSGAGIFTSIRLIGEPPRPKDRPLMSTIRSITPGYFRALGMQVLRGRDLEWNEASTPIVVSKSAADAFWPGRSPIDRQIAFNINPTGYPVIGEVNDTRQTSLAISPGPIVYISMRRYARVFHTMTLIVRGSSSVDAMAATIRGVLHDVDPRLPLYNVQTMKSIVDQSTAQQRLDITLLGIFAGAAMLLATLGIYGVVSYSVAQRRHEMGIRLTLGAERADILRLVVGEGLSLTVIGVAIGAAGSLFATRLLQSLLFEIRPSDPLTFVLSAVVLIIVAGLASFIPARRAAQVDPLVSMRAE